MSPIASQTSDKLNLYSRWTNASKDLYMYLSNITDKTVDIRLSDYEEDRSCTFTVGDILYLPDGAWVLTAVAPDDEELKPWDRKRVPNAVFSRYF